MRRFFYNAKKHNNEIVQNYILAESISDAAIRLEQKGLIVLDIKEEELNRPQRNMSYYSNNQIKEFSLQEKKEFFNALYHLYKSGLPIVETFRSIKSSTRNKNINNFCAMVINKLERGKTLRETLKNYSSQLGLAYTMLIAAGEESGKLTEVLEGILKNIKKQEEIKSSLIRSLVYPALILFLALGVGMLFFFFVFKMFNMAAEDGVTTAVMLKLLKAAIIKIIIVYAVIISAIIYVCKNKVMLETIKSTASGFLFFGNILRNYYFANFFNVLALSYQAGVPMTEALILSGSVINLSEYKIRLKKSQKMVEDGCKVSTAFATANIFSGYAMSQVSAGEESGELDKMFKIIAHDYEEQLDTAIGIILKLIGPMMIIVIGIFIGGMVIAFAWKYYNYLMSMF